MPNTLISIITPSYNRADFIERCIASVCMQTHPNIEHIVIDGGSTDGTLDVLRSYTGSYNLHWISEPDHGMYDAINKGIALAQGEIISYLNTDDCLFPYAVQEVRDSFARNPTAGIVYGDWVNYFEDTGFIEFLPTPALNKYDLAVYGCLPQPAVFLRRSIFASQGVFDTAYRLLADNELFTRAAASNSRIVKLNEVIACQVIHSGNLLAGNPEAVLHANYEGARYRSIYQERIFNREGPRALFGLGLARIRSIAYPLTWRFMLLQFLLCGKSQRRGKWDRFSNAFPNHNVDWSLLRQYLTTHRSGQHHPYCVDHQFLQHSGLTAVSNL